MIAIDPELRRKLLDRPLWYHTVDVAPDLTIEGMFDLRGIVDRLPWPDVRGKRCLDIGTYDGFLAFELEKRGAAEVVAVDVAGPELYDWSYGVRPGVAETTVVDRDFYEPENGRGFALLAEALGSKVEWKAVSIYDLSPATVGEFDVVVCSSLLLHLRDPIRALEAVRSVCRGPFMTFEPIDLWLTRLHPRRAAAQFDGHGFDCTWWIPNGAAQLRMLSSAGFVVERVDRPMIVPFVHYQLPGTLARRWFEHALSLLATGSRAHGSPQRAVIARPRGADLTAAGGGAPSSRATAGRIPRRPG